jgi:hypothetical protein
MAYRSIDSLIVIESLHVLNFFLYRTRERAIETQMGAFILSQVENDRTVPAKHSVPNLCGCCRRYQYKQINPKKFGFIVWLLQLAASGSTVECPACTVQCRLLPPLRASCTVQAAAQQLSQCMSETLQYSLHRIRKASMIKTSKTRNKPPAACSST